MLMLMAKSRHRKLDNIRRYVTPSAESGAEVTGLLTPVDSNSDYLPSPPRNSRYSTMRPSSSIFIRTVSVP